MSSVQDSGCVPCRVCGGSQDRGWHKHPTSQDRAAEVLAEHGWRHTATTHCMCGWRSPLAQLAVDGYYAHVAAALAEAGLLADMTAALRHMTDARNALGDALDAARDEVAEWQVECGRIAFERDTALQDAAGWKTTAKEYEGQIEALANVLANSALSEYRAADESRVRDALIDAQIEGWKAAMHWLAEYKGADGIALAKEMATRLSESSE